MDIRLVAKRVDSLRARSTERDNRWDDVKSIRTGDIGMLIPDGLPEGLDHSFVSNIIETAARDLSELLAPLPSLNCDAIRKSERAKKSSGKRTKIANYYTQKSRLKIQMLSGSDHFWTYGMTAFIVEPDFKAGCPMIRIDDPIGTYFDADLYGNVKTYVKVWNEEAEKLAAKFPEHAEVIRGRDMYGNPTTAANTPVEVVKYMDADQVVLYMPDKKNRVLRSMENALGVCPVVVGQRPSLDAELRGQFDEALWIQVARARMALWTMEATKNTVQAPLAVPSDVQRMAYGPNAILRTNSPEKVRRVGVDFPEAGVAMQEILEQNIRESARYPETRSGGLDASIITGQGVQALLGGFDSQVKAAQMVTGEALERVIAMCFKMDEKFWPNAKKKIRGVMNGTAFEDTYVPSKDIARDHTVDVVYGFAAGMDPARALVFLLQLRGDQLIPRNLVQRQLPMELDIEELQREIDVEQTNDALKQGMFAILQNLGILAQSGIDPVMILTQAATMIEQREKGIRLHEAILKAFTPPPAPEQAPAPPGVPGEPGAAPGGPPGAPGGAPPGVPPGVQPSSGLPFGVAAGQAGMGPGGKPDLATLLAGLTTSGNPQLSANVRRAIPA